MIADDAYLCDKWDRLSCLIAKIHNTSIHRKSDAVKQDDCNLYLIRKKLIEKHNQPKKYGSCKDIMRRFL